LESSFKFTSFPNKPSLYQVIPRSSPFINFADARAELIVSVAQLFAFSRTAASSGEITISSLDTGWFMDNSDLSSDII
jgi:hypothetical protein